MARQGFSMAAAACGVGPPAAAREGAGRAGATRASARGRPRASVERGVDAGDRARVLADEPGAEAVDQRRHAFAAAFVELGPAREALIGGHLQERIGVPAAVGVETLELAVLHPRP